MDVELLFSAQPFASSEASSGRPTGSGGSDAGSSSGNFAFVRPSHSAVVDLSAGSVHRALADGVVSGTAPGSGAAGGLRLTLQLGEMFKALQV